MSKKKQKTKKLTPAEEMEKIYLEIGGDENLYNTFSDVPKITDYLS